MEIKVDEAVAKTFTETEVAIACSKIPCFKEWHNKGVINIMEGFIKSVLS